MQRHTLATSTKWHIDNVLHGDLKTDSQSVVLELAALATTGNVLEKKKKNRMSHPRPSESETAWAGPEIHGPCDSCFMLKFETQLLSGS